MRQRSLKQALLGGAPGRILSGVAQRSGWTRDRFVIICYHSVATRDEHEWNPELYVSHEHLRERFQRLRALGATVLSLDDALQLQDAGKLPPRSVVLTFDDGTVDFASIVVPLLQEFGFPATVYATTLYVPLQLPMWPGYSRYLIWLARERVPPGMAPSATAEQWEPLALGRGFWDSFDERWRNASPEEKDLAVLRLARLAGIDEAPIRDRRAFHLMTEDEIRALPKDLVSVQLHTHGHHQPAERASYVASIEANRAAIERLVGCRPSHFCYPSGVVTDAFVEYLTDLEIASATTCWSGLVAPGTNRLLLPRLIATSLTPAVTFDAWVTGSAGLLQAAAGAIGLVRR